MLIEIDEIIGRHARMIECSLVRGDRERALAAVHRCFDALENREAVDCFTSLASLLNGPQNGRLASLLGSAGIVTVGDLIQRTPQELCEIRHISRTSIETLETCLRNHGFSMKSGEIGNVA